MINFFTLNPQGTLTYVNVNDPRHRIRLATGSNLWTEYPEEVDTAVYLACLKALRDRTSVFMETFRASDETWWEWHIYPVPEGLAVYCEDITEAKKIEDELRHSRDRELIEARKKIDDLKRAILRSAIDSHFIFSTLSSIQNYILVNDCENAANYLSSFARLIRGVLNSTVADRTTLADEIHLLRSYVKMEQLRRVGSFDFDVVIAQDIDLAGEIPPMLIQPFIENAIVHGLHGMQVHGHIVLSFEDHEDRLLVTIEDNGVGRDAAARHKTPGGYHSLSSSIIEERLRLLDPDGSMDLSIEDKVTGGTKVSMSIPWSRA